MFSIQDDDQQFSRYIGEDSVHLTNSNSKDNYDTDNKKNRKFNPLSLISYDKIQFGDQKEKNMYGKNIRIIHNYSTIDQSMDIDAARA